MAWIIERALKKGNTMISNMLQGGNMCQLKSFHNTSMTSSRGTYMIIQRVWEFLILDNGFKQAPKAKRKLSGDGHDLDLANQLALSICMSDFFLQEVGAERNVSIYDSLRIQINLIEEIK